MAVEQSKLQPIPDQRQWRLKERKDGESVVGYILSAWYVEANGCKYRVWALVDQP